MYVSIGTAIPGARISLLKLASDIYHSAKLDSHVGDTLYGYTEPWCEIEPREPNATGTPILLSRLGLLRFCES